VTDLTPDEKTVLLIAARGEPMIPIGRWKGPTEALIARGYLVPKSHPGDPTGYFNNYITLEGRQAYSEIEKEDDESLGRLITASTVTGHEQKKARAHAEQIAVQLVDLAEASSKVTGDSKVHALREWAKVILERALEMMK
jgi:hypothetical protein